MTKSQLIDKLVEYELECFYNNSFENQKQLLASLFQENYKSYDMRDLDNLVYDLTGEEV